MIPTVGHILEVLEGIAPNRYAEPWDNPGLQVGSLRREVRRVFAALDATLQSLRSAAGKQAQLLLTHHPLIFRPLSRLAFDTYPGQIILEAARGGISVMAAHTNLDVAPGGINDILADLLTLQKVQILKESEGEAGVGLGRIGDLAAPRPLSEMAEQVKETFHVPRVRVVGDTGRSISRVAVVGGSGGGLATLASEKGADLLLTGDVHHHHALEAASQGLAVIDAGHFHTERAAFQVFSGRLQEMLTDRGWDVEVLIHGKETDPIRHE